MTFGEGAATRLPPHWTTYAIVTVTLTVAEADAGRNERDRGRDLAEHAVADVHGVRVGARNTRV